ncbi:MAG: hypothetical protein RL037_158 [Bacteroidota bacterium]
MVVKNLILFLFISHAFLSVAQTLKFELSTTKVTVGERLELKVISDITGSVDIKTPKNFHYGSTEQSGMQQQLDHAGRFTVQISYIRDGYFDTPGNFTLGPVILRSGKKVLTSNTLNVTVSKTPTVSEKEALSYSPRELRKPAFGVIQPGKLKIYEGEGLVLESKVISRVTPDNMTRYRAYSIDGSVTTHEIGNPEEIKAGNERIAGLDWHTFTFDRKVSFFNKKGKYKLKPFDINLELDYSFFPVRSSAPTIEVLSLPDNKPKDFIGVVGELQLSTDFAAMSIEKGDILTFKLELKGKGNIQNALTPIVKIPKGWKEYAAPKPTSKYTFTEEGAEGILTYEYCFKCLTSEPSNWEPISVSYFDPKEGKYKTLKSEPVIFNGKNIVTADQNESNGNTREISKTSLVQQAITKEDNETLFTNPIFWFTIASIIVFALLIGILGKPKFKKRKYTALDYNQPYVASWNLVEVDLDKGERSYQQGETSEAVQYIENALCKAISISLQLDYREFSVSAMAQSYLESSNNVQSQSMVKEFFYQCQLLRYGHGMNDQEWEHVKSLAGNLIKVLK